MPQSIAPQPKPMISRCPTQPSVLEGEKVHHRKATADFFAPYLVPICLLLLTSLALVWAFIPELAAGPNQYSDTSFHLAILQQMHDAVQGGGSAFDFFFDGSPFGHALVRAYQSLPHLTMYLVYRALFESVSFPTILTSFTIIFAALLPWSFFWMSRLLGFSEIFSAFVGVLSVLISEVGGYGMGMQNYSWGTHGIISQLWAILFVAPAIGCAIRYLRTGEGLSRSLFLAFLACGSHLLSVHLIGFTVLTSAGVLALFDRPPHLPKRLLCFVIGCGAVISYQLVTLLPDSAILHQSVLEPSWKFTSRGIKWTYDHLIDGTLFDEGRISVFSFMALVGACLFAMDLIWPRDREQRAQAGIVLASFVVWLSLLSGYEVWGWLFGSISGLSSMHMHRFIVGVHIFGIFLAARAFAEIFRQIPSKCVALMLSAVVLYPLVTERIETFKLRHTWIERIQYGENEERDLNDLLALLRRSPRGWVYSGMAKDWAQTLKVAQATPLYHRMTVAGLPSCGMLFHPFALAGDVMFEFDPLKQDRYDLFDVRYVVAPPTWTAPRFLTPMKTYTRYVLYEYPGASVAALGHLDFEGWGSKAESARFMSRWINLGASARGAYGEIVRSPTGVKPGILFSANHLLPLDTTPRSINGRIVDSLWKQEQVHATILTEESALTVFKIGYHPRWELMLDGKRAETLRVTPGFIGAQIEKGEHRLELRYRGSRWRAALFFACLLLPLILSIVSKRSSDLETFSSPVESYLDRL